MTAEQDVQPKREHLPRRLMLALLVLSILTLASPAAALVAVCGLLPTMVVMVFDATYEKTTACAVGGMNLAGVFPFLPPLLLGGRHGTAAFDLFHDLIALVVMYGAAACGWLLVALLPLAIHALDKAQAAQAISRLKEQQRRLIEEWGPEVSGRRP